MEGQRKGTAHSDDSLQLLRSHFDLISQFERMIRQHERDMLRLIDALENTRLKWLASETTSKRLTEENAQLKAKIEDLAQLLTSRQREAESPLGMVEMARPLQGSNADPTTPRRAVHFRFPVVAKENSAVITARGSEAHNTDTSASSPDTDVIADGSDASKNTTYDHAHEVPCKRSRPEVTYSLVETPKIPRGTTTTHRRPEATPSLEETDTSVIRTPTASAPRRGSASTLRSIEKKAVGRVGPPKELSSIQSLGPVFDDHNSPLPSAVRRPVDLGSPM